jgi:hypothetical protein
MDAERQHVLQPIVAVNRQLVTTFADASAGINAVCTLLSKYTRATAFITSPKKTPKKIATRNDGFSGFTAPGTPFRTGKMS